MIGRVSTQYDLAINFSKSVLETLIPLWIADAKLNFRGGSVSHAKQTIGLDFDAISRVTGISSTSIKTVVGVSVSSVNFTPIFSKFYYTKLILFLLEMMLVKNVLNSLEDSCDKVRKLC